MGSRRRSNLRILSPSNFLTHSKVESTVHKQRNESNSKMTTQADILSDLMATVYVYLYDMDLIFLKKTLTTQLEKDLRDVFIPFHSFMHKKKTEMLCPIELFNSKDQKDQMVKDIFDNVCKHRIETHKTFCNHALYDNRITTNPTQLEMLLKDKLDNLDEYIDKKTKEGKKLLQQIKKTKKETHTYSHPTHKYSLRSIHKKKHSKQ